MRRQDQHACLRRADRHDLAEPALLSLAPPSYSFATTPLGRTRQTTFTLNNMLGKPATLSSVLIVQPFSSGGTCVAGGSLGVGASCTITVQFTPTIRGSFMANVMVQTVAGDHAQSRVSGRGVDWVIEKLPVPDGGTSAGITALWIDTASNGYALDTSGTILRRSSSLWQRMGTITGPSVQGFLWGSGNDVYSSLGALYYSADGGLTNVKAVMTPVPINPLNAIWGAAPTTVYAVTNGTQLYDGATTSFNQFQSLSTAYYEQVIGVGADLMVVGTGPSGGLVQSRTMGSWSTLSVVGTRLHGIWGTATNDFYLAGEPSSLGAPFLVHSDGSSVAPQTTSAASAFVAIWGDAPDDVFAVARGGEVWRGEGIGQWLKEQLPAAVGSLTSVGGAIGPSGVEVWVGGSNGILHRY